MRCPQISGQMYLLENWSHKPGWHSFRLIEAVHDRLAKLFRTMGDFISAEQHADQALELCPSSYVMRLQVTEISESQLHFERVAKFLASMPEYDHADESRIRMNCRRWRIC